MLLNGQRLQISMAASNLVDSELECPIEKEWFDFEVWNVGSCQCQQSEGKYRNFV